MNERDFDAHPYTSDEERVATFLSDRSGIGGGDDPIGFILASYVHLIEERNGYRAALRDVKSSDAEL